MVCKNRDRPIVRSAEWSATGRPSTNCTTRYPSRCSALPRIRGFKLKVKFTAMAGGMMLLATAALALPPMEKVFQSTYTPAKNGKLVRAKCVICHVASGKTALNPYGKDVKVALNGSMMLMPENLKAIESKDSDGDGVKNIDEIK